MFACQIAYRRFFFDVFVKLLACPPLLSFLESEISRQFLESRPTCNFLFFSWNIHFVECCFICVARRALSVRLLVCITHFFKNKGPRHVLCMYSDLQPFVDFLIPVMFVSKQVILMSIVPFDCVSLYEGNRSALPPIPFSLTLPDFPATCNDEIVNFLPPPSASPLRPNQQVTDCNPKSTI